jgi:selenocysteine lyase/cysteine desulfurase
MNRRELLKNSALAAALFGLPVPQGGVTAKPVPERSLLDSEPETYWTRIRKEQFLLPDWRVFLNNGSLGVAPKPVVAAVTDYLNRSAALDMKDDEYPRWGYETLDAYRTEVAAYVGCNKDELALTHNATEGLSTIAAGIDLKAGDEVVMTDQEHSSGRSGWYLKKARFGVEVREVKIPLPPKDPGQLADLMISAIGPRTRVILFSGITSPTGLILPIRAICDAARAKGVIAVVDGAHMHGQMPVKISDLNCDFFVGSPHKWMFAPAGCGFLYVREEWLNRLWPLTVTGGWDDQTLKAGRFMRLGTNNRAILEGLMAGMHFSSDIGHDHVYARIHQLGRMAFERARRLPYIEMLTPDDDRMYAGMVTFRVKKDGSRAWEIMRQKRMWSAMGEQIRHSTHIHTRPQDIDLFFGILEDTLGKA